MFAILPALACGALDITHTAPAYCHSIPSPRSLAALKDDISPRIVGGSPVSPRQYEFISTTRSSSYGMCGATLIAPDWLVSAAHCLPQVGLDVLIGHHDLNTVEEDECVEARQVTEVIIPPKGHAFLSMRNDIALLRLNSASSYRPVHDLPRGAEPRRSSLSL